MFESSSFVVGGYAGSKNNRHQYHHTRRSDGSSSQQSQRPLLTIYHESSFQLAWSVIQSRDDLTSTTHSRRSFVTSVVRMTSATTLGVLGIGSGGRQPCWAQEQDDTSTTSITMDSVQVTVTGDATKLFNEARALESQGNMLAAQRLYNKVTKLAPRFIYGWSNLGNTQTALGDLDTADTSYTKAIGLCRENLQDIANQNSGFGGGMKKCNDLYVLLLNRGSLRLNNGRPKEALADLQQANTLRGRPDALILQNLARAEEVNGLYRAADADYNLAISMTANEVNPFWLRSANVKYQLGDIKGGMDLLKRVENRFPEAPEVRAAYATFLATLGDQTKAQQKFLEIPDRQRLKYTDSTYLTQTIAWPPAMIEGLSKITKAVGDSPTSS